MSNAIVILNQLITMAIYILIGFILRKTKLISKDGCASLANLLLYVILPCVIFKAFIRDYEHEATVALGISIAISVILLGLSMCVSIMLFRKNPIDVIASSFSNAGFLGIPLITATIGAHAIFYIAGFVALLNILQWIYGQRLIAQDKSKLQLASIFKNPLVIAFALGLIFYFVQIPLPKQISNCVSAISACNAPVAMIIIGYYLSEIPLSKLFTIPHSYLVSAVRLLLVPLLSILAISWYDGIPLEIKLALAITASAPVGTNVAVYARKLNKDYPRAVILICQSTLFCIITMPIMIWLMSTLCA